MKRPWIWIIVVANLLGLVALAFVYPRAMVSPGDLVPAHAEIEDSCFACHAPFRGIASDRCVACHALADIGVRSSTGAPVDRLTKQTLSVAFHQQLTDPDCGACHSDHGRLIERRFSHSLLRQDSREDCATCHAAPANELHRDLRVSCSQCHTTEHWSPATFDHAALPKTTLASCESCHAPPKDDFHQKITTTCTQCHSPQRWKPSSFNHDRFFLLDRNHNVPCVTCHIGNDLTRYTCFGCHEHTPANIRAEHEEEGVGNVTGCVSCHRSADGEGGEGRGGLEHPDDD